MNDKCIVYGCSNRKNQGSFTGNMCTPCHEFITAGIIGPTDSFLGEMEKNRQELRQLLKDTWMMLDHAANIDFSNGNVHSGIDEGSVRGWEFYHDLRKKVEELGLI